NHTSPDFPHPGFAYQICHSIGDCRAKYQLGSYCHASGGLHAFADDIEIHQGAQSLKEYLFGSHTIRIFFCGTCGANVYNRSVNPKFIYGKCAINVSQTLCWMTITPVCMRLLQGIDLEAIQVTKRDGKDFCPPPLEGNPL
ncbi:uncharacterized protein N7458_010182, partial [Penicillium daleae]